MKISIITVCFNSEKHIKTAIESVINQTYKNIEYIVIDGASKDNTVNIVKSYGDKITKFISEPDKGIYDAMNKGFKLATGDYLAVINSDDFYMCNDAIESVVNELNKKQTDSLFADLIYVDENNTDKQVRYWKSNEFIKGSFKKGWHPAHPTFFVKNGIYKKYGYFDLSFKLAADFELMLRFLEKHQISSCYLPKPIIKMRLGGATNKNIKNIYNQNIECYRAFKVNHLSVSIFYPLYRLLPKLVQFFK
ncbi:MAG: glycosyltransferase [Flavobacteriales bacterium]|nr:glycosyltransferase [Flavobacteriales bacterium]